MGWIGPLTNRQYETWQEWLGEQWSKPSRTDHYLMQLAAEVQRTILKDKTKAPDLRKFKIPFGSVEETKSDFKPTPKQLANASRSKWSKASGMKAEEISYEEYERRLAKGMYGGRRN